MNDTPIGAYVVDEPIYRELASIKEEETGADPEVRLAGKVDIIFALKKFPEIKDTCSDDKQATQRIGHCLEPGFLHKENIDGGDQRKGHQAIEKDPLCISAADDHPHEINIKAKGKYGSQVAVHNGIYMVQRQIFSVGLTDTVIE